METLKKKKNLTCKHKCNFQSANAPIFQSAVNAILLGCTVQWLQSILSWTDSEINRHFTGEKQFILSSLWRKSENEETSSRQEGEQGRVNLRWRKRPQPECYCWPERYYRAWWESRELHDTTLSTQTHPALLPLPIGPDQQLFDVNLRMFVFYILSYSHHLRVHTHTGLDRV